MFHTALLPVTSILLALTMPLQNAWAWGDFGHEVVGEIAQRLLEKDTHTQQQIQDILGVEPLALSAVWADHVRFDKRFDPYGDFHFKDESTAPSEHKDYDATVVMKKYPLLLTDSVSSRETKMLALRYLIHVVGDAHQPLHFGVHSDFGGNACKVYWKVPAPMPESCKTLPAAKLESFQNPVKVAFRPAIPYTPPSSQFTTNIHEIWDEHMVDYLREWVRRDQFCVAETKTPGVMKYPARQFTYVELAQELMSRHSEGLDLTQADLNIDSWVQDSTNLRKAVGYPDTLPSDQRPYCLKKPDPAAIPGLTVDFLEADLGPSLSLNRRQLVEKRLVLAGVRLAALLKKIFANLPASSGPKEADVLQSLMIKNQ